MIKVTPAISLDESEISVSFIRASGPGGQNVNKLATAVQLRFALAASTNLSEAVKERLRRLAGNRVTNEGELVIEAKRHRTQVANRREALDRLVRLIQAAATPPKPRLRHRRPSRARQERRLSQKHQRGEVKRTRRPVRPHDD